MAQAKSVPDRWKTAFVIVVFLLFLLLTIPYVPLRSHVSRTYSGGIWDPESSTMGAEVTASMEAVRTRYLLRSHASEVTGTITLEGAGLDGSHTLWIRDPDDVTPLTGPSTSPPWIKVPTPRWRWALIPRTALTSGRTSPPW